MSDLLRTGVVALIALGGVFGTVSVFAADHTEAPLAAADPTADIADFYAWHTGTGDDQRMVFVLTQSGFTPPMADAAGSYDRDVLYGIHIDTDGDLEADHSVWVRFAQDADGDWGMQVSGVPGSTGPLVGAVETALEGDDGSQAWAGLADDPFFFNAAGFDQTLATGTLSFDATDQVAGLNVTAIVIEFATGDLPDSFTTWAETRRFLE